MESKKEPYIPTAFTMFVCYYSGLFCRILELRKMCLELKRWRQPTIIEANQNCQYLLAEARRYSIRKIY